MTYVETLHAAMALSPEERKELAETLLESVDLTISGTERPALSEAWRQELARRSAEIDTGTVICRTWEEVRERARRAAGLDD